MGRSLNRSAAATGALGGRVEAVWHGSHRFVTTGDEVWEYIIEHPHGDEHHDDVTDPVTRMAE